MLMMAPRRTQLLRALAVGFMLLAPLTAYAAGEGSIVPSWIGWVVTIVLFAISLLSSRLDRRNEAAEHASHERVLRLESAQQALTRELARTREEMVTRVDPVALEAKIDRLADTLTDVRDRTIRLECDVGKLADTLIAPLPPSPSRG